MTAIYLVKFSKTFVSGSIAGLTLDAELSFATLVGSSEFVDHCLEHASKPVSAIGGSDYTCHCARVEVLSTSNQTL
jgi:hypothetical protein